MSKDSLYAAPHLKRKEHRVSLNEQAKILKSLDARKDAEAGRIKRFFAFPDLTRTEGSPIRELVRRILDISDLKGFDVIEVPEIVPADVSFDVFNFPEGHPARNRSDTYYVTDEYILRTHTTIMWHYYLMLDEIKKRISKGEPVGVLSYGKVYRKDEIDRNHMNVFHQMDGLYLARREEKKIGMPELEDILVKIARAIYGQDIKYRFNKDTFPYTDPSLEMEIEVHNRWVEVLGSGVVHRNVLKNMGVDPNVYNGWAFGFGLERLAILSMGLPDIRLLWSEDPRVKRQLTLGTKYQEVSKYPPIVRDISFIVDARFVPNDYFDLIRDIGGDLIEEVSLLDKYESEEKFGKEKVSYTYHIVYRSNERTLRDEEIAPLQEKLVRETESQFGAEVR